MLIKWVLNAFIEQYRLTRAHLKIVLCVLCNLRGCLFPESAGSCQKLTSAHTNAQRGVCWPSFEPCSPVSLHSLSSSTIPLSHFIKRASSGCSNTPQRSRRSLRLSFSPRRSSLCLCRDSRVCACFSFLFACNCWYRSSHAGGCHGDKTMRSSRPFSSFLYPCLSPAILHHSMHDSGPRPPTGCAMGTDSRPRRRESVCFCPP